MKKRIVSCIMVVVLAALSAAPGFAAGTADFQKPQPGEWGYRRLNIAAWLYTREDGELAEGLENIDGFDYYFEPVEETVEGGETLTYSGIHWDRGKIVDGYYRMEDYRAAVDRWIPMSGDGEWAYFGKDGRQVFGRQTIDGQEYDFGEKGTIAKGEAPFPEMEIVSITLGEYEETAVAGETVEIPFTIMVKTLEGTETASPANAAEWVEHEADYEIFKNAYDVNQSYSFRLPQGRGLLGIETKFGIDWDRHVIELPVTRGGWAFEGDHGTLSIKTPRKTVKAEEGFSILCLEDPEENPEEAAQGTLDGVLTALGQFEPEVLVRPLRNANKNGELKKALSRYLNDNARLRALENEYIQAKDIKTAVEVDPSAALLLGGSAVSTVGLGLSVDSGTVQLKVTDSSESVPESFKSGYQVVPLDLSVYHDGEKVTERLSVPAIVTLPIPQGMKAVEVYHVHDGGQEKVDCVSGDGKVTFAADEYSMYLLVETQETEPEKPSDSGSGGSSSGGSTFGGLTSGSSTSGGAVSRSIGSSVLTGKWMQDETGWWYQNPDGSYPVNVWAELDYNGKKKWYHFDAAGYMQTGWFTDTDGRRYYLNPVSDGTQGAMAVGWRPIDGCWYYFNEVSDGYKGALYTDTTTPDGYKVDAGGRWVS